MSQVIRPAEEQGLQDIIAEANAAGATLEVIGSGTKRKIGRPLKTSAMVSVSGLDELTLYEPNELVLSARSGTSLKFVERTLAAQNQRLEFEPLDYGPLLGGAAGEGTIGAVFAGNFSGARRIQVGAARDHMIGVRAVNGIGKMFKSGGRVMKNVTGYDLCKGLAGSWGTLGVMTEVTMKVAPIPETSASLILRGLNDEIAIEALCRAMGTPYEVSGTLHLPPFFTRNIDDEILRGDQAATIFRIENFEKSVIYRTEKLKEVLSIFGDIEILDDAASQKLWAGVRQLHFLQNINTTPPSLINQNDANRPKQIWRISTAPQNGPRLVESIRAHHGACKAAYEWSGGLIWLVMPATRDAGAFEIRRVVAQYGGHATLICAEEGLRQKVDVFQPQERALAVFSQKLKQAFDPNLILNPGRMHAGY